MTAPLARQMDLAVTSGVVVTDIEEGSLAESSGLQPGDVVLELNRQPIPNFDVFQRLADPIKPSDLALLLVNRQGNVLYIPVKGRIKQIETVARAGASRARGSRMCSHPLTPVATRLHRLPRRTALVGHLHVRLASAHSVESIQSCQARPLLDRDGYVLICVSRDATFLTIVPL